MPFQKGRDFLLRIGNGEDPEIFSLLGAARATSLSLENDAQDATPVGGDGTGVVASNAGVQQMRLRLDGLFANAAAEEALRLAAFDRAACNYELQFPNGDRYRAVFVVESYARAGNVEGFESFTAVLARSGAGIFTAGV